MQLSEVMQEAEYCAGSVIKRKYGVCSDSLRKWSASNKIRFVKSSGGKRYYHSADVHKLMHGDAGDAEAAQETKKIIYARVSSPGQRGDLQRQCDDLRSKYPSHELISDIASGINFKRRGLKTILEKAHKRVISEVVVTHKDRLCRFAFDLIRDVLERSGCKIVVLSKESDSAPNDEAELADDMLAIANVFVAKRNGQRSATNRKRRQEQQQEAESGKRAKSSNESA